MTELTPEETRTRAASGGVLNTAYQDALREASSGSRLTRMSTGIGSTVSRTGGIHRVGSFQREGQVLGMGGAGFGAGGSLGASVPATGGGRGSGAMVSTPIYYDPRYSTPDKFYFPRSEVQANAIWRHLYRSDPAISTATDMYAELPWSEFDLGGVKDPHVKKIFESMVSELNLLTWLPVLSREFLMLGKAVPQLIYDARKNYWTNIVCFNPDYLQVKPVPVPGEEPVLDLLPTPELKAFASSTDPRLIKARQKMPQDVLYRAMTNLPIPLDPVNATYLARRSSPYSYVGTSLYTRLYRIQMLEDFLTNATLAVAQRNAAPLRVFKLGDPQTGWVPGKADEEAFLNMLAIAETDPFAAIVYHFGLQIEYVGVSDRLLSVSREYDYIERVKFLALGISKSFIMGETSYASAIAGLQTLVERLQTFRRTMEMMWLRPKVFESVAKMNEFYERSEADLAHRVRTKKSEGQLIVPRIQWRKRLEPTQDASLLQVWMSLHEKGLAADRDLMTGAGLDLETSRRSRIEEFEYRQKEQEEYPEMYGLGEDGEPLPEPGLGGPELGGPGGPGPLPGLPSAGPKPPGGPAGPAPVIGPPRRASADAYQVRVASDLIKTQRFNQQGFYKGVHFEQVEPMIELLRTGSTNHPDWFHLSVDEQVRRQASARRRGEQVPDMQDISWDTLDSEMVRSGWLDSDIAAVREILTTERVLRDDESLDAVEKAAGVGTGADFLAGAVPAA